MSYLAKESLSSAFPPRLSVCVCLLQLQSLPLVAAGDCFFFQECFLSNSFLPERGWLKQSHAPHVSLSGSPQTGHKKRSVFCEMMICFAPPGARDQVLALGMWLLSLGLAKQGRGWDNGK